MEVLKDFCSNFIRQINQELSFFCLSKEEIEQECALVWFENKLIEHLYVSGEKNQAFALFRKALKKSSSSFSINNKITNFRIQKEIEKKAFAKMTIADDSSDDKIYNSIMISNIKKLLNNSEYKYIIDYYEYGMKETAIKYGLSESNTRVKALRIIRKIKDGMSL